MSSLYYINKLNAGFVRFVATTKTIYYNSIVVRQAGRSQTPFLEPKSRRVDPARLYIVFIFLAQTINAATFYLAADGSDFNPGTINQPWKTIAYASTSIQPGDQVILAEGLYRDSSITFGPPGISPRQLTIFKSAPGARVIISTNKDTPPNVEINDYVRIDGLWLGGKWKADSNSTIFTGGSPIGRSKQIVRCTLFGYTGISQGSAMYNIYQGNRFVLNGLGRFLHPIYVSGGYTNGEKSQHTIIDHNLFVTGEGYAIHGWHETHCSIVTRNFVTGHFWGLVMDGADHFIANNFFWKMTGQSGAEGPWGPWLPGDSIHFYNNIMGPDGSLLVSNGPNNVLKKNAFLETVIDGEEPITLQSGQEKTELGLSAQELDSTIAALGVAFSRSIVEIFADAEIESLFTVLRISLSAASPLYQTGQRWINASLALNIGTDCPAPKSERDFWETFRNLGLRDWDENGQVVSEDYSQLGIEPIFDDSPLSFNRGKQGGITQNNLKPEELNFTTQPLSAFEISFFIHCKKPSALTLRVYKLNGKRIGNLWIPQNSEKDFYIRWRHPRLGAGIYFASLQSENQELSKKFLLVN